MTLKNRFRSRCIFHEGWRGVKLSLWGAVNAHMHSLHTHTHTHTQIHIHIYIQTHTHTLGWSKYTHSLDTHTHTRTHTHTHAHLTFMNVTIGKRRMRHDMIRFCRIQNNIKSVTQHIYTWHDSLVWFVCDIYEHNMTHFSRIQNNIKGMRDTTHSCNYHACVTWRILRIPTWHSWTWHDSFLQDPESH